jgi:hypothetical protein
MSLTAIASGLVAHGAIVLYLGAAIDTALPANSLLSILTVAAITLKTIT